MQEPIDTHFKDALHRLQAYALIWLVSATLTLTDDAAMLAVVFC